MIDGSEKSIRNLKLILYCFEWLSGLKINYHKSEVFVFGVQQEEKELMDTYLTMGAFDPIFHKMIKRLDPWRESS